MKSPVWPWLSPRSSYSSGSREAERDGVIEYAGIAIDGSLNVASSQHSQATRTSALSPSGLILV